MQIKINFNSYLFNLQRQQILWLQYYYCWWKVSYHLIYFTTLLSLILACWFQILNSYLQFQQILFQIISAQPIFPSEPFPWFPIYSFCFLSHFQWSGSNELMFPDEELHCSSFVPFFLFFYLNIIIQKSLSLP